jgi:hypothetical protein
MSRVYRSGETPWCFGNEKEHAQDDPDCIACDFEDDCVAKIEAKRRSTNANLGSARERMERLRQLGGARTSTTTSSLPSTRRERMPEAPDRKVMRTESSFMGALVHNSGLEMVGAMFREMFYAVTQIPRMEYRSPWEEINRKEEK